MLAGYTRVYTVCLVIQFVYASALLQMYYCPPWWGVKAPSMPPHLDLSIIAQSYSGCNSSSMGPGGD